jgi:hypothetical protein
MPSPPPSGLVPSAAEEECGLGDPAAAYAAADAAASEAGGGPGLQGLAALAAALLASPRIAASGPLRQLQLLRAAWAWVLGRAAGPPPGRSRGALGRGGGDADDGGDCAADACCGPPTGTWDVGHGLFGSDEAAARLEQVRGDALRPPAWRGWGWGIS